MDFRNITPNTPNEYKPFFQVYKEGWVTTRLIIRGVSYVAGFQCLMPIMGYFRAQLIPEATEGVMTNKDYKMHGNYENGLTFILEGKKPPAKITDHEEEFSDYVIAAINAYYGFEIKETPKRRGLINFLKVPKK